MAATQMLAGFHAVIARLRQAPDSIREVYVDTQRKDKRMQSLIDHVGKVGRPLHVVGTDRLEGLSSGARHQGVVAVADVRKLADDIDEILDGVQGHPLLLILDGVTDPHNLGACLRTADAAGVHAVVAPKDRAVGLNTTVQRVACGAAESVPYIMVTNLARTMRDLKDRDIWLVGTDDQAPESIHHTQGSRAMGWVMGAEGEGMRRLTRETCDELVHIPMLGSVESLNVSVATAICLFESVRQRCLK